MLRTHTSLAYIFLQSTGLNPNIFTGTPRTCSYNPVHQKPFTEGCHSFIHSFYIMGGCNNVMWRYLK